MITRHNGFQLFARHINPIFDKRLENMMLTKMPTGIWKNFFILSPTLIYLKYPLKASEKKKILGYRSSPRSELD